MFKLGKGQKKTLELEQNQAVTGLRTQSFSGLGSQHVDLGVVWVRTPGKDPVPRCIEFFWSGVSNSVLHPDHFPTCLGGLFQILFLLSFFLKLLSKNCLLCELYRKDLLPLSHCIHYNLWQYGFSFVTIVSKKSNFPGQIFADLDFINTFLSLTHIYIKQPLTNCVA